MNEAQVLTGNILFENYWLAILYLKALVLNSLLFDTQMGRIVKRTDLSFSVL